MASLPHRPPSSRDKYRRRYDVTLSLYGPDGVRRPYRIEMEVDFLSLAEGVGANAAKNASGRSAGFNNAIRVAAEPVEKVQP